MNKAGILLCSVNKIGKVFRIKTQTGQSAMFFCVLGKRERFLVEEMQTALSLARNVIISCHKKEFLKETRSCCWNNQACSNNAQGHC